MAGRISRFLHLEKPRGDGARGKSSPLASPGRFEPEREGGTPAEEKGTQDQDAPVAQTPVQGRFRPEPAPPQPPAVGPPTDAPDTAAEEAAEAQPFQRCARCEADSSRFAESCQNCSAPFDTPDQRVFNERLWARLREEQAHLDEELSELRSTTAESEKDEREARRLLGILLARQVAEAERARLSWMPGGDRVRAHNRSESLGLWLLRRIKSTRVRLLVAGCLLVVGAFIAHNALRGGAAARVFGIGFFWVIVLLFGPRRRRRLWPF